MHTIELDEILDISHANSTCEQLKTMRIAGDSYQLNAGKVEHVDSAGVQLLLAFVNAVRTDGGQVKWQGMSDKLQASIERLGLLKEFDLKS